MRIVYSARAKVGLRDIALFIARDNRAWAITFLRELDGKVRQIGDMPHAYPLVPRYEQHGIRRRAFRDYLIFYRTEADRIVVVHIMHGARDFEPLLFPQA